MSGVSNRQAKYVSGYLLAGSLTRSREPMSQLHFIFTICAECEHHFDICAWRYSLCSSLLVFAHSRSRSHSHNSAALFRHHINETTHGSNFLANRLCILCWRSDSWSSWRQAERRWRRSAKECPPVHEQLSECRSNCPLGVGARERFSAAYFHICYRAVVVVLFALTSACGSVRFARWFLVAAKDGVLV